MDEIIVKNLDWYIIELDALNKYYHDGNTKAMEASLTMLRLDAGRRAKEVKQALLEGLEA